MRPCRLTLATLLLLGGGAAAADRPVTMAVPPEVAKGVAAMPVIADPADDAERRINAAVGRLDATVRKAVADCRAQAGKEADWGRSVDVAMRGPGFLSYLITDNSYCGGPHPNVGTMSIVYDLRTGRPVDWTALLPSSLTGTVALAPGADGTKMVTLASKRLFALFLAGYDKIRTDGDCRDAVREDGNDTPPGMMAWLDAKGGGLAVQFDLPHVVEACAEEVVIPAATLRAEGAKPALLAALAAARR